MSTIYAEEAEKGTHGSGPPPSRAELDLVERAVRDAFDRVEDVQIRLERPVRAWEIEGKAPAELPTRAEIGDVCVFAHSLTILAAQLGQSASALHDLAPRLESVRTDAPLRREA